MNLPAHDRSELSLTRSWAVSSGRTDDDPAGARGHRGRPGARTGAQALRELYAKYGGTVYGRCQYLLKDPTRRRTRCRTCSPRRSRTGRVPRRGLAADLADEDRHPPLPEPDARRAGALEGPVRAGERAGREGHGGPAGSSARAVRKLLARFDVETQAAAIHYYVDEMTLEEVAALLGRSVPTVRKRLQSFAARDAAQELQDAMMNADEHLGELKLRRLRRASWRGAEARAAAAHAAACAQLPRAKLRARRRAAARSRQRFPSSASPPASSGRRAPPAAAPAPAGAAGCYAAGAWPAAARSSASRRADGSQAGAARANRLKGGGARWWCAVAGATAPQRRPAPTAHARGARRRASGCASATSRASTATCSVSVDEQGEVTRALPRGGHEPAGASAAQRRTTCPTAWSSPARAPSGSSWS